MAAAHPEELIRFNQATGKFEVGKDALNTLARHRGPVGVVAVCGRARQGKSYILNQLLGQSSGFQVAPTHRPCTKGLWMWSSPIERQAPDGSKYHMVLLDTEGIDAYDQMGGIDEAALDRLSLVTEMTKHIRVRAGQADGRTTEDWELGEFTPSFIWLLRDFYLSLEEDGHAVTPRDYLETALRPVGGNGPSVEAKNQIRASIKGLFPDRECFTLVRPVNDEKVLQHLEKADAGQLRPEFRQGLAALTKAIFQRGQPKRMGRMTLNGPLLAGLTKAYVDAINNGAVPCISTAWRGVAEAECRRGAEEAEAEYVNNFNTHCGGEVDQLDAEHRRTLDIAMKVYDGVAVGDDVIKNAHRDRWVSAVASRYENFRDKRLAEGALACEQMLSAAQNRLHQMSQSGMGMDAISDEFNAFMTAYTNSSEAAGPAKFKRLQEFMKGSFNNTMLDVSKRQEQKIKEIEEEKRQAMYDAEESRQKAAAAEQDSEACRAEAEASRAQAEASRSEAQACRAEAAGHRVDSEEAARRSAAAEQTVRAALKEAEAMRQQAEACDQEAVKAAEAARVAEAEAASWRAKAETSAAEASRALSQAHAASLGAEEALAEARAARDEAARANKAKEQETQRAGEAMRLAAAAQEAEQATAQRAEAADKQSRADRAEAVELRRAAEQMQREVEAARAELSRLSAELDEQSYECCRATGDAEAARAEAAGQAQEAERCLAAAQASQAEATAVKEEARRMALQAEESRAEASGSMARAQNAERSAEESRADAEASKLEARAARQEVKEIKAQLMAAQQMSKNQQEVYQQQMQEMLAERQGEQRSMETAMEAETVRIRAEVAQVKADLSRAQTQLNEKERRVIEAEHQQRILEQEVDSMKRRLAVTQEEVNTFKIRAETAERERLAAVEGKTRAEDAMARAQAEAREGAVKAARSEAAANAARTSMNEAAGDFTRRLGQWEAPAVEAPSFLGRSSTMQQEEFHSPMATEQPSFGLEQPNMGSPIPDARTMTIPQMKDWLVRHGKEDIVSQLSFARAKKAEWVDEIQRLASG